MSKFAKIKPLVSWYPKGAAYFVAGCLAMTAVLYGTAIAGFYQDHVNGPEFWQKFASYELSVGLLFTSFAFIVGATWGAIQIRSLPARAALQ